MNGFRSKLLAFSLPASLTAAAACSSELQPATGAGSGSAQSVQSTTTTTTTTSATTANSNTQQPNSSGTNTTQKPNNADATGAASSTGGSNGNATDSANQATPPVNIAIGVHSPVTVIDFPTGGTATSTQNAGGTLVNGGTVATDPSAAPGTSAVGPNIMPSIDRAPTSGVGDITMGTGSRWTDTGNLKTLTLDCWGESSFSGSAWQGDCRVITPGMMSLDLTLETTSHTWSLTTGSGCSPFKVEDAVLGTETVLRLMFVGTNIPTCVPSTTVQLRATTHNGTVFTLSKRLYL